MLNKKYFLSEDWSLQKIELGQDVKYYLLNIRDGDIYRLNDTSYTFLILFDGNLTCDEIIKKLTEIYNVDKEKIKKDFEKMVSIWLEKGILKEGR